MADNLNNFIGLTDEICRECGFDGRFFVRGTFPHNVYTVCPQCDAVDSEITASRKDVLNEIEEEKTEQ